MKYIQLTWTSPDADGTIDMPVLPIDDHTDPALIERCARRAFWTLVSAGYGDVDDIKVSHDGKWLPMGPQKVAS